MDLNVELGVTQFEEYHQLMYNKNCEILKRLDIMPDIWKEKKKREMYECTHHLKKWKASSPKHALESYTRTFMDVLYQIEKKTALLSEIDESCKIAAKNVSLYKDMEKGMLYNKKYRELSHTLLRKEDKTNFSHDFSVPEKGSLAFERLNELVQKSEEGEIEKKKLIQLKKQMTGK